MAGVPRGVNVSRASRNVVNVEPSLLPLSEAESGWIARTTSPPHEFVHGFQELINSLPEQIALLDENWVLLAVNRAWIKTAELYGVHTLGPGADYFEFVEARANENHRSAMAVRDGIVEMNRGTRDSFRFVYSGADRWEGHQFQICINRLEMEGHRFVTITRYDVTELLNLRRLREDFSSSMIEGQAEERRRMARDIHDSTMQLLVGIGFAIGQLRRTEQPSEVPRVLAEMEQLLGEAQQEIRSISYLAHPPTLEKLGLRDSLQMLVEGYGRRTNLASSFHVEGDLDDIGHPSEVAIYRLVQEALSNVHRHAKATEAVVGLFCRRSMVHAVIVDNGVGVTPGSNNGVGLPAMQARVAELGGRLVLRSRSPGTAVIASLPRHPGTRAVGDLALHA